MASSPLDGIRLKLQRARNQTEELKADIVRYLDGRPCIPLVEFDAQSKILTARVKIKERPDPMLGIRVGEIIHNIRSPLDHIVYELFLRNNRRELPHRRLQFPIFEIAHHRKLLSGQTEYGFEDQGVKVSLRGISATAINLIRAEQPMPKTDGGTGEGRADPLWHLNELWNADKHRTIHVMHALLDSYNFGFGRTRMDIPWVVEEARRSPGPIDDDVVLARRQFLGIDDFPFETTKVDMNLGIGVAFNESMPTMGGALVWPTIIDVTNRVEGILARIAKTIFGEDLR